MSLSFLANQEITAPKQIALIRKAIGERRAELISLSKTFQLEKRNLETTKAAIDTHTHQHSYLLQLLEIHKRDVSSHENDLSDILDLNKRLKLDTETSQTDFLASLPSLPSFSAQKKGTAAKIKEIIEEIRDSLRANLCLEPIYRQRVNAMGPYQEILKGTLMNLKAVLGPIKRVPAEVWSLIFRHYLLEGVQDYVQHRQSTSYQSTPIILSQVSRLWREVVHTNRDLWKYFLCRSGKIQARHQAKRWKHHCSFEPHGLTLFNTLHALSKPRSIDEEEPPAPEVMSYPHSIHLFCPVKISSIRAANQLPFRDQPSLTLQMLEPANVQFLNALASAFPSFSKLEIIQAQPFLTFEPELYTRRNPPIESLTLDLGDFTSLRIGFYCDEPLLKEIHIIHNGTGRIRGRSVLCPLLETVGATPPDSMWLKGYKLPALRHLVLYGPKLQTIEVPSLVELSQHPYFHNVKELELRKWPQYTPIGASSWNIMPLLFSIAENLRSVRVIRCVDSFIDGEALVSLVMLLKNTECATGPSRLTTVIIDTCTGITLCDCELIAGIVSKLVVHV